MKHNSRADKILDICLKIYAIMYVFGLLLTIIGNSAGPYLVIMPIGIIFVMVLLIMSCSSAKCIVSLVCRFKKNVIPVELFNFRGQRIYSIAKVGNDTQLHACKYWFLELQDHILLPNGRILITATNTRQYFWLPLNKSDRAVMLLTNSFPDFNRKVLSKKSEMTIYQEFNEYYDND